jgi:hypothetical protein
MPRKQKAKRKPAPKRVPRLLDLECSKRVVLNTLGSPESVVFRYRIELESRQLAPATINLRLAVVRRLAHEATATGLLSPELAAGIQRVKGTRNWACGSAIG